MTDRFLAKLATLAIRAYQIMLSRWLGRQCLFRPTCSARAHGFFKSSGWKIGLKRTRKQLRECCGTYSLHLDRGGQVVLTSHTGHEYPQDELAPFIIARLSGMGSFPTRAIPTGVLPGTK